MTVILPASQSSGAILLPNTITEAYRAWVAIETERNSADDQDAEAADRLTGAQLALEEAAAEIPATTAADVWMLWAMASPDVYGDGAYSIALCVRARHEARAAAAIPEEVRA
ncbi:MAG: hypothetical protein JNK34_06310 [Tabrizicola sp.]|nr:hypothetical protein [Tabrizicola sp.]